MNIVYRILRPPSLPLSFLLLTLRISAVGPSLLKQVMESVSIGKLPDSREKIMSDAKDSLVKWPSNTTLEECS